MIKCPQCSYHNIDDHRFCQQCGTSLTQRQCIKCGHLVDLEATHCCQCQHPTATIWWTLLISPNLESEMLVANDTSSIAVSINASQAANLQASGVELKADPSTQDLLDTIDQLVSPPQELETTVDLARESEPVITALPTLTPNIPRELSPPQTNPIIQRFLAENPRYQLLEASTTLPSSLLQCGRYEFSILDTQPFQISPLAIMLSQLQGAIGFAEISQPGIIKTFLETQPLSFPPLLEPYLALRQQFPLFLPYVHDAWQSDQQSVILLENRTDLPTVKEVLASEDISAAQILHWMQQILYFAIASSPWRCSPSVLHVDNLKVDQGNVVCLQQLLFEKEQQPIDFNPSRDNGSPVRTTVWENLRHVWLDLCQDLGPLLRDQLHLLLTHLQTTTEVTQAELQSYLSDQSQQLSVAIPTAGDEQVPQQTVVPENGEAAPTLILPNQLIHLSAAGQTDDGRDRHHNEDFFVIEQHLQQCIDSNQHHVSGRGLYILCDGMGGHDGGEIASSLAAETLTQYLKTHWQEDLPDAQTLQNAIGAANDALFQVNKAKAGSNRMGTTLVMALVQDTHIHIAHVGDSRLYQLTHQSGLEQLTTDHEVGQREILRGTTSEVAYARPDAFQLTQALGPRESKTLEPDIQLLTATEDTLLLICSDGLTDNQLLETHGDQFLQPMLNSQTTLQYGVNELVSLANQHNGHDNITVIAILMRVQPQKMSSH